MTYHVLVDSVSFTTTTVTSEGHPCRLFACFVWTSFAVVSDMPVYHCSGLPHNCRTLCTAVSAVGAISTALALVSIGCVSRRFCMVTEKAVVDHDLRARQKLQKPDSEHSSAINVWKLTCLPSSMGCGTDNFNGSGLKCFNKLSIRLLSQENVP
jgi:hypothetical protein